MFVLFGMLLEKHSLASGRSISKWPVVSQSLTVKRDKLQKTVQFKNFETATFLDHPSYVFWIDKIFMAAATLDLIPDQVRMSLEPTNRSLPMLIYRHAMSTPKK